MTPAPPAPSSDQAAISQAARDLAIIVNTYQKPRHLALVLASIAAQSGADGRFEVVVTDDGSTDDTAAVVRSFAARADFPVRITSQPHDGFRLARTRNAGARLTASDYLLFLDGDCILPRDHVATFLARRRPGTAQLAYCARLTEAACADLDPDTLAAVDLDALVPDSERRALARRHRKAWWHQFWRHPSKPRLAGGNCGVWRRDFERVNGCDERFVGWGQEDDDLGLRLRATGVRLESILDRTWSLHVWHPVDGSATPRWRDGVNVPYFLRRGRLTRCRRGLVERTARDLLWGLPEDAADTPLGRELLARLDAAPRAGAGEACEVDVVIRPGRCSFGRPAECRLLLVESDAEVEPRVRRRADQIRRLPRGLGGAVGTAGVGDLASRSDTSPTPGHVSVFVTDPVDGGTTLDRILADCG